MEEYSREVELTPSNDRKSSLSLQTMVIMNEPGYSIDSSARGNFDNKKEESAITLEISNSIHGERYEDHPYRHISSLNYAGQGQKSTYESSASAVELTPGLDSEEKRDYDILEDSPELPNAIKIIHSRSSSESTQQNRLVLQDDSVTRNISYASQAMSSGEKENEQPNCQSNEKPGH